MIIHHHLGLGDHFVCNGIVNIISEKFDDIFLACKKHNFETIKYLYSENKKVNVFGIDGTDEFKEVDTFSVENKFPVLRIGFEKVDIKRWDRSFYEQVNIPFNERYDSFRLPLKKPTCLLSLPNEPYILIHNDSSSGTYDLKFECDFKKVFVSKIDNVHMLGYIDLIHNAEEIHCVDSSFFHLVDSIKNLKARLFFHDIRRSITCFEKAEKWNIITYE